MTAVETAVLPLECIRHRRPVSNALAVSPVLAISVALVPVVRAFLSRRLLRESLYIYPGTS
jgi:hypothetical protein